MPELGTKEALAASVKELMAKKSFARISISDICEGCGLNRKSFYYHFKDKYDLMNWIFYTDFITLSSETEFETGWELFSAACYHLYEERKFYYAALQTEGQNSFRDYFKESARDIIISLFDLEFGDETDRMMADLISAVLLSALDQWLGADVPVEPEVFLNKIREIMLKVSDAFR